MISCLKTLKTKNTLAQYSLISARLHDTVNHDILLKKLCSYGFRGKIGSFLKSYLTNKKQLTKVGSYFISNYNMIHCGVPQGSILGPLLFSIYIDDLPNATDFHVTLFADDTGLVNLNLKLIVKLNLCVIFFYFLFFCSTVYWCRQHNIINAVTQRLWQALVTFWSFAAALLSTMYKLADEKQYHCTLFFLLYLL